MSELSGGFDWNEWFDDEAVWGEQFDADLLMQELEDAPDYGGVDDGFGHIISDADPGL